MEKRKEKTKEKREKKGKNERKMREWFFFFSTKEMSLMVSHFKKDVYLNCLIFLVVYTEDNKGQKNEKRK